MIVIVLGMHKSGTTLVAQTLSESGIDMGVSCHDEYPRCKYEDPQAQVICRDILYAGNRRHSLDAPSSYNDRASEIRDYVKRQSGGNWGIKVPDMTLCYDQWRDILPFHRVIGVRRNLDGVMSHYMRRRNNRPERGLVAYTWHMYNTMLRAYRVPIISFEDLLARGPVVIEEATGLSGLPDFRDGREHI